MANEEIFWREILTPDRGLQKACSIGEAEKYLGLSQAGLLQVLNRNRVKRYKSGNGRTKYLLQVDLEQINRLRSEVRIAGSEQTEDDLLEQAAVLFSRITCEKEAGAIQAWLEQYQKYRS